MSALDNSYERAIALIDDVEPRLSSIITEEDTKLQLIVRFLTEVLGWDHADLSAERKNDNGYGFVTVEQVGESAFLHASVLERSGIDGVHDGDALIVDVSRSRKGIAVSDVRKAEPNEAGGAKLLEAVVIKMFEDRGYGFVYVPSLGQDAFFHVSILPEQDRRSVNIGKTFRAEINTDSKGRGLQVRRIG